MRKVKLAKKTKKLPENYFSTMVFHDPTVNVYHEFPHRVVFLDVLDKS